MVYSAGKLWSMRRLADAEGRFKMTAVDQRPPIMNLVRERRGVAEASYDDIAEIKRLLTSTLAAHSTAMLLDPVWAYGRCIEHVRPGQGLLMTIEDHAFEDGPDGRRSSTIPDWSVSKIKRLGADGVKALAWYRPDAAPDVRAHQQAWVERLGAECRRHDICFLLELLVYPLPGEEDQATEYVEHGSNRPSLVVDSVRDFADPRFGIDILKLESPVPAAAVPAPDAPGAGPCQDWFDRIAEVAHVPWVMLSAGANMAQFERVLHYAYGAGASGYLAGRAIWLEAASAFPDLDRMRAALEGDSVAYMERINALTHRLGRPWFEHPGVERPLAVQGAGERFPSHYAA